MTIKALIAFQKQQGLAATGIPDALTQFMLSHESQRKQARRGNMPRQRLRNNAPEGGERSLLARMKAADERLTRRLKAGLDPNKSEDWVAQLATYETVTMANRWVKRIMDRGFPAYVVQTQARRRNGRHWYIVWLGPWYDLEQARADLKSMKSALRIRSRVHLKRRTPEQRRAP